VPGFVGVAIGACYPAATSENVGMVFPDPTAVWLFCGAAVALLAIPGPAVLYVVVQSAEQGRRAGLASVGGIHVGSLVHVAAATAGLSALIVASAVAFSVVKYAGAAYLVYLGVRKLLERPPADRLERAREPLRRAFLRGIAVNVLNPKTALFFLAFLPQFVDPDRGAVWSQVLVLGLLFVALGLVSDSLYAVAAGTIGGLLRRRRTALRYGSGLVYIGLGAAAAAVKRT
jgi:threonine/homoserine/homoserine lactone efflux protein